MNRGPSVMRLWTGRRPRPLFVQGRAPIPPPAAPVPLLLACGLLVWVMTTGRTF